MDDLEKAKKALIAADAAGDVESATALAQHIQSLMAQQKELTGSEVFEGLSSAALRGFSFGTGAKVKSALGTAIAKPVLEGVELFNGRPAPSYNELYNRQLEKFKSQEAKFSKQMPISATLAEISGGIGGGIGLAGTKPARALWSMAGRGGNIGRISAGALAGETAQRVYETGQAPSGEEYNALTSPGVSMGGVLGGAFPAAGVVGRHAGRKLIPVIDEAMLPIVEQAKKYKIPLSIDQITSGRATKKLQNISQDVPFSGQAAFKDRQLSYYNKALLGTVGIEGDKITRKAMDDAFFKVGKKFDAFGKGKTFESDALKDGMQEILNDAPSFATQDAQRALGNNIEKVLENIESNQIKGEKLNQLRIQINRSARKAKDADTVELLKDLENVIVETLAQGDEMVMREAKQQYKNLLVLEPLAAKAKGGNISPTQLTNRVHRIYGREFVRGRAGQIGELADIGRELLPELGGSDTAAKFSLSTAILAGVYEPSTFLLSGGVVAINRAIQSGVNRNQAIINNMTKKARNELMLMPPDKANRVLDSISISLGLGSGMTQREAQ